MDPNKVFSDMISFVENLNISIKSSLVSRIRADAANTTVRTETHETAETLKEENLKLRKY